MECALKVQWITINLMMLCLRSEAETDECGDVIMKASAAVASVGSSITVSCSQNQSRKCQRMTIKFNGVQQHLLHEDGNSVSIRADVLTHGRNSFTCTCENRRAPLCGIYIKVGNPPDEPRNVSCIMFGALGNITCTWDPGRDTYIRTEYALQFGNGTPRRHINASKNNIHTFDCRLISVNFSRESNHTVRIIASNYLGKAISSPLTFTFMDIVKPRPPTHLSIEFPNLSANNCTIKWRDDQQMRIFRLRFRSKSNLFWNTALVINTTIYDLHDVTPFTEYEFQVSGKFYAHKGKWSDWSLPVIKRTPEAVPTGKLDVWYKIKEMANQSHKITLLWTKMSLLEAKGRILHYEITFQKQVFNTTQMWLEAITDTAATSVAVSACNTKGKSPPTYLNISNDEGLPFPESVVANASNDGRIVIIWNPPITPPMLVDGYIVEWSDSHRNDYPKKNWMKVPASTCIATLSENINPYVCYYIDVYAVSAKRAGMASHARGYATEMAPKVGPEMSYELGMDNSVFISWEETLANKQMGCIIRYTIYLQQQHFNVTTTSIDIPNDNFPDRYKIKSLKPNVAYRVWMTSSTEKGEGPRGNEHIIYIHTESTSEGLMNISLTATLLFAIGCLCVCFLQAARQRILWVLHVILPQSCSRPVPDPANSSWAKEYKSVKDKMRLLSNQLSIASSSCEEPETIEVEEIFTDEESGAFRDAFNPCIGMCDSLAAQTPDRRFQKWTSNDMPREHEPSATGTRDDGSIYKCQIPCCYKSVVAEHDFPDDSISTSVGMTVSYLPTNVLPDGISCPEDNSDTDQCPFLVNTFSTPFFSFDGKLTLDAVKIDCSSFTHSELLIQRLCNDFE
ncbi:interleukin-12 receptor subunit beta-2 [Ambystoma mexicanum]|uniref:interleukin-12 receptor subunit beta-2 n=1 Tax=Ambystoma mexicanum TaxID=8296 RepID=UPI0037E9B0EE